MPEELSLDRTFEGTFTELFQFASELFEEPSIAMEAGGINTTLTQTATQSGKTDQANNNLKNTTSDNSVGNFSEQVKNEAERTIQRLERINASTLKFLQNTWNSNEEFISNYDEMQKSYKLQDELTVINWSYGHNAEQYLVGKLIKLRAAINTNVTYLTNWQNVPEDAIIRKNGKALDKAITESMGAPSSIDSVKEYMGHLRAQFRGRKGEKTYRGDMANGFINDIRNFAKTKTSYNENIQAAMRAAKQVESVIGGQIRNGRFVDNDRRQLMTLMKSADKMILTYASMIHFCYRLSVEYILNRRLILSRLYQK